MLTSLRTSGWGSSLPLTYNLCHDLNIKYSLSWEPFTIMDQIDQWNGNNNLLLMQLRLKKMTVSRILKLLLFIKWKPGCDFPIEVQRKSTQSSYPWKTHFHVYVMSVPDLYGVNTSGKIVLVIISNPSWTLKWPLLLYGKSLFFADAKHQLKTWHVPYKKPSLIIVKMYAQSYTGFFFQNGIFWQMQ